MCIRDSYIIVGTKAINSPEFVENACKKFHDRIIAGLDSINNKLALNGWSNHSELDLNDVAIRLEKLGVSSIIFTSVKYAKSANLYPKIGSLP